MEYLALNEECRKLERGYVFHTPLTENTRFGHVCDLIFSAQSWSREDILVQDTSTWSDRLRSCRDIRIVYAQQQQQEPEQEAPRFKRTVLFRCEPAQKVVSIGTRFLLPISDNVRDMLDSNIMYNQPGSGPPASPNDSHCTRSQEDESNWLLVFDA